MADKNDELTALKAQVDRLRSDVDAILELLLGRRSRPVYHHAHPLAYRIEQLEQRVTKPK